MPTLTYQSLFDVPLPPQVPLVALADQIIQPPPQPPFARGIQRRWAGARGGTVFAFYPPWVNVGWEVQSVQPPHRNYHSPETGDAGNELPKGLFWYNAGWEVQPPQPPARPKYRSPEIGDAGNQAPFPVPAWGWDVQPWQPPHPKYRSPEPGDPGSTEAKFVALNYGFEIQPIQPPHIWRHNPETGDLGNEAPFPVPAWNWEVQSFQPPHLWHHSPEVGDPGNELPKGLFWYNAGWEVQSVQPGHPKYRSPEVGDSGNEAPVSTAVPLNYGFEIQPVQPPHIWRHSPEIGDQGNEAVYQQWYNAGWEVQSVQPPHIWRHSPEIGDQGDEAQFINWFNAGWEIQSFQPGHPKYRSPEVGDPGNEAPASTVVLLNYGFEIQPVQPPHIWRHSPEIGDQGNEAQFINWFNAGWEVQSVQPGSRPSKKPAGIFPKEDGTEAVFVPPPPQASWWGEPVLFQPPLPINTAQRRSATRGKCEFTVIPFPVLAGWEIQPWQPPAQPSKKPAALFTREDGNEAVPPIPLGTWWEIQPPQPPTKPSLKPAAVFPKSDGNEGIFFPQAPVPFFWWAEPTASQPLYVWRKDPEFGDAGIQAPFIRWFNAGWEVQPPQPPAKPKLTPAATFPKEDGTEAAFIGPQAVVAQWWGEGVWLQPRTQISTAQRRNATRGKSEFAHSLPPSNTFLLPFVEFFPLLRKVVNEYKYATFDRGDEGIQDRYQFWKNWGWEIQPPQPPRLAAIGKSNTLIRGDDGTQAPLINWFNVGWDVQPWQPPHPKWHDPEEGSAEVDVPLNFISVHFNDYGWDVQPWQPVFSRYLNRAAIKPISQGIEGVGSLIPFIVPMVFFEEDLPDIPHPRYRTPEFGDSGTQLITGGIPPNAGFEVQSLQPPYRRYNSPDIGEGGIEQPFFFSFPVPLGAAAWQVQEWQPPYPIRTGQRREATRGNTLFAFYPPWLPMGWEVQSVQPPYGSTIQRRARGAEGRVQFGIFPYWIVEGWESILPDLRHELYHDLGIADSATRFTPITIVPVPLIKWDEPAIFNYSRGRLLNQHLAALIENNALPYPPGTITASTIKEWIIRARRRNRR